MLHTMQHTTGFLIWQATKLAVLAHCTPRDSRTTKHDAIWGAFATLSLSSSACPTGPGLGWPVQTAATHRVCVHVSDEPCSGEVVFVRTTQIDVATLHCNSVALPCFLSSSTFHRAPGLLHRGHGRQRA